MESTLRKIRLSIPRPDRPTQEKAARLLGMSQGNYAKKEGGVIPATEEEIHKLASFCRVDLAKVLGGRQSSEQTGAADMELIIELNRLIVSLHKKLDKAEQTIEELTARLEVFDQSPRGASPR